MPKRNKHYSAYHLLPRTQPYVRCRWCQYDFSCIRGHYARSQHCQKLELEYINKRSKPDPIPFNNFAIVTSLNEIPNCNTLDEYQYASLPNQEERSSKFPSRTKRIKNSHLDINISNNDSSYRYKDDVSVMNSDDEDSIQNKKNLYKLLIPNVENDFESIDSSNDKENLIDFMCDNQTNISIPEVASVMNNAEAESNFDNESDCLTIQKNNMLLTGGDTDIVQLQKNNKIRELLSKLNNGLENNIHIPSKVIPRPIVNKYYSYCVIHDVLTQANVPLYMYDKIIKVIMEEVRSERITPEATFICRRSLLKWMEKTFRGVTKPVKTIVQLETPQQNNGNGILNHRTKTEVITFDFKEQLIDILNDVEIFSNLDNLVINKDTNNPNKKWLPYEGRSDGQIFETLDGAWYQNYAKKTVIDTTKQFCVPIGLYIDASETVVYQRYSFQPLIMFPLILTCKTRNQPRCSRVLALIPDLEANSSAVKKHNKMGGRINKSLSIRNYHKCLSYALESLKIIQRNGGFNTFLRLGDDVQERMITVPVAFVLGDAKSQDTLTCRYGPHNTERMCRACHVSFQESDDITHQCKWVQHNQFDYALDLILKVEQPYHEDENQKTKDSAEQKEAYRFLKQHSQHVCINAFQDIDFAGFPRGIFGCTPHDMMHCFLEGILKYTTRLFIHSFTPREKAEIDEFVDHIFHNFCSSENKNMLRKNFNKGMTNMTMITADEEIGMALVLLIIGQMDNGRNILQQRKDFEDYTNKNNIDESMIDDNVWRHYATNNVDITDRRNEVPMQKVSYDEDSESDISIDSIQMILDIPNRCKTDKNKKNNNNENTIDEGKCNYENFVQLIEILLCFHAWYKSTVAFPWNKNNERELLLSIRKMLYRLQHTFPRNEGNGWKLQKLHEILHLPIDVTNFGSPKNFDTGIMENRLIHVGKKCKVNTKTWTQNIYRTIRQQNL